MCRSRACSDSGLWRQSTCRGYKPSSKCPEAEEALQACRPSYDSAARWPIKLDPAPSLPKAFVADLAQEDDCVDPCVAVRESLQTAACMWRSSLIRARAPSCPSGDRSENAA